MSLYTYETVKEIVKGFVDINDISTSESVIEDVLLIVNHQKKYPPRGDTEDYRVPEDISTALASVFFNVDPYNPY